MKYAAHALILVAGVAAGWALARRDAPPTATGTAPPAQWVARLGDQYITQAMFEQEMLRRGGRQPGQFQDLAQKQALLDDMLLHLALVDAARRDGIDRDPETRRSIEQLLTTRYLQDTLRKRQNEVRVDDAEVAAFFEKNVDDYTVPARRRVAMIRIAVTEGADDDAWKRAETRAADALAKARALERTTPHFGVVAREFSEDQATRYRGGVLGWLTEGRSGDYRHDRALLDAAYALQQPGDFSPVLRGADGVYVARLVELQPRQSRSLEQLRAGIQQRLTQDRYQVIESEFRKRTLAAAPIERHDDGLAAIKPPGPPATDPVPQPPAMPGGQEAQP